MDYSIKEGADGLHIDATVPPEMKKKLMDEIAKCAAGTCTCPSSQYDKLKGVDIISGPTGVAIELKVKPGERIDLGDVERCLEHTAKQIQR
jgi:hypothetical protein